MTITLAPGDRVRLNPRAGGDVFDLALAGRKARIDVIEEDFEGRLHVGVVLDDDPGADLGARGQPGHHFYFSPEEVERLGAEEQHPAPAPATILVAGIGNIFMGDDGFGVEVVQRLLGLRMPAGVLVRDIGIRGLDLAYLLLDGPAHTILIDACPRNQPPGTLTVLEPDLSELDVANAVPDAHDMNPLNMLRVARAMGAELKNVVIVGCEPETLGPEEGLMGLSEPVAQAVPRAIALVEHLISRRTS